MRRWSWHWSQEFLAYQTVGIKLWGAWHSGLPDTDAAISAAVEDAALGRWRGWRAEESKISFRLFKFIA